MAAQLIPAAELPVLYAEVAATSEVSPGRGLMRILSRLRFPIPLESTDVFEADLEKMLALARESPGFCDAEVFRKRVEADGQEWVVYLILSEWESYEALYAYLNEPAHLVLCRAYKPKYEAGRAEIRRYQRLRLRPQLEVYD